MHCFLSQFIDQCLQDWQELPCKHCGPWVFVCGFDKIMHSYVVENVKQDLHGSKVNLMLQIPAESCVAGLWGRNRSIVSGDLVFWMGDLNYRLNMPCALVSCFMATARPKFYFAQIVHFS